MSTDQPATDTLATFKRKKKLTCPTNNCNFRISLNQSSLSIFAVIDLSRSVIDRQKMWHLKKKTGR